MKPNAIPRKLIKKEKLSSGVKLIEPCEGNDLKDVLARKVDKESLDVTTSDSYFDIDGRPILTKEDYDMFIGNSFPSQMYASNLVFFQNSAIPINTPFGEALKNKATIASFDVDFFNEKMPTAIAESYVNNREEYLANMIDNRIQFLSRNLALALNSDVQASIKTSAGEIINYLKSISKKPNNEYEYIFDIRLRPEIDVVTNIISGYLHSDNSSLHVLAYANSGNEIDENMSFRSTVYDMTQIIVEVYNYYDELICNYYNIAGSDKGDMFHAIILQNMYHAFDVFKKRLQIMYFIIRDEIAKYYGYLSLSNVRDQVQDQIDNAECPQDLMKPIQFEV